VTSFPPGSAWRTVLDCDEQDRKPTVPAVGVGFAQTLTSFPCHENRPGNRNRPPLDNVRPSPRDITADRVRRDGGVRSDCRPGNAARIAAASRRSGTRVHVAPGDRTGVTPVAGICRVALPRAGPTLWESGNCRTRSALSFLASCASCAGTTTGSGLPGTGHAFAKPFRCP